MFSRIAVFLGGIPTSAILRVQTQDLVPQTLLSGERFYDITLIADGGILHTPFSKLRTNKIIWLGDWDSCGERGQEIFESMEVSCSVPIEKVSYENEKDLSDFAIALEAILKHSAASDSIFLDVFAGLGGRKDHELINLLEAADFAKSFPGGATVVLHPSLIITTAAVHVYVTKGTLFSVISLAGAAPVPVKIENAKYRGDIMLSRPSHGLSNVAESSTISVAPINGDVIAISLVV